MPEPNIPTDKSEISRPPEADSRRSEEAVRLLIQHQPEIRACIAALLPNRADADEVLQEVNIIAWRKFPEFDENRSFVPWVCGIAHFEVLRFRREQRHGKLLFGEELINELAERQVEISALWDDRRQALSDCLSKLANSDRKLLEASYLSGSSAKNAAEQLNRPVNTVYKALNRIRERLFECVERTLAAEGRP